MNFDILDWLRDNGHLRAEKILERESWNTKRREKYSNAVVDGMEANGEMRYMYRDFKQNLEDARSARVSYVGISSRMGWLTVFSPGDMGVDSRLDQWGELIIFKDYRDVERISTILDFVISYAWEWLTKGRRP